MTIPELHGCGGLEKKLTEKPASSSRRFNVQKVCNIEQPTVAPICKKRRFYLVLEFCALFYKVAFLFFGCFFISLFFELKNFFSLGYSCFTMLC